MAEPRRDEFRTTSVATLLAVADNVVIDVEACRGSQSDSAYDIARQNADKLPI